MVAGGTNSEDYQHAGTSQTAAACVQTHIDFNGIEGSGSPEPSEHLDPGPVMT